VISRFKNRVQKFLSKQHRHREQELRHELDRIYDQLRAKPLSKKKTARLEVEQDRLNGELMRVMKITWKNR